MQHTKESLLAFEEHIRQAFLDKLIHAPIHLSGGNEEQLIEIFRDVRPTDYVFSNWRSHYHALLHGLPEQMVMDEVLAGRSMYLMSAAHRFLCSSIVGGILPIACGVAMGIRRKYLSRNPVDFWDAVRLEQQNRVWVFVGDMCARSGAFHEFVQYSQGHNLPVRIVVEDDGLSVCTPTLVAWGGHGPKDGPLVTRYKYERTTPHSGVGQYVAF